MKTIYAGSLNPVKINAIRQAFQDTFPDLHFKIEGHSVSSGVPDQPMTEEETRKGAFNRIEELKKLHPDIDYYAAIEGGIKKINNSYVTFASIIIQSNNGTIGIGETGIVEIPTKILTLVQSGMELGHANDEIFKKTNSKHSLGMTGLLTDGKIKRDDFYYQAIVLALTRFSQKELYE